MKICPICNQPITQGHDSNKCGRVKIVSSNRFYAGSEFNNKTFEPIKTNTGFSAIASGGAMALHLKSTQEQIRALQEKEKRIKESMNITE